MVASLQIITGAAGTGKTFKIKDLVLALQQAGRLVYVVAPTNKAANVLNERFLEYGLLFTPARTIHSALYSVVPTGKFKQVIRPVVDNKTGFPKKDKNGEAVTYTVEEELFDYKFKTNLSENLTIIIDEASMVTGQIWLDIFTYFKGHLVVVGDPNQLMPVEDLRDLEEDDPVRSFYQYFNQLAENPTHNCGDNKNNLRLTKDTVGIAAVIEHVSSDRNPTGRFPDLKVENGYGLMDISSHTRLDSEIVELIYGSDITICWQNVECEYINEVYRKHKAKLTGTKYKEFPVVGDRIIAESHFEVAVTEPNQEKPVRNRVITKGDELTIVRIDPDFDPKVSAKTNLIHVYLADSKGEEIGHLIPISVAKVFGGKVSAKVAHLRWCYAYAITCHKAQGSGWNTVLVLDSYYLPTDARRWRYTSATRARSNLIVVVSKNTTFNKRTVA